MNTGAQDDVEAWVLAWQKKLHRWAATNKEQKYRDIYNLAYDPRTLQAAWNHVRANKGSRTAGIDGWTRHNVEAGVGVEKFLQQIHQDLKAGTYRPSPVREKGIPKFGGKVRYLGIPTLRDRVIQQALRMVLEPIYEADFYGGSYAYRPGRRAQDAIQEIFHFTKPSVGYSWIVEGDIRGCFDNVHHGVLLEEIQERITDRDVLHLVRAFLKAGVMKEMGGFRKTITGTPQGGILSPLLANIYLNRLDRHFKNKWDAYGGDYRRRVLHQKGQATCRIVRFADDFVILVRGTQEHAESLKRETAEFLKEDLHMELSWEKTGITHIEKGFDFLGFHMVLKPNHRGQMGIRVYPSKKSLRKVQTKAKKITSLSNTALPLVDVISQLNPVLRGWAYYFRFAHSKTTLSYLGHYAWERVFRWMRKKHPKTGAGILKRRYCPDWIFRDRSVTLFNPGEVRVQRYGYRGAHIPTPWNQEAQSSKWKRQGDRLPDEPRLLTRLEESCSI